MADERRPVLLTVSGTIPDDLDARIARGERPRADYRVLARRLGADVVDVPGARAASGLIGRVAHRIGGAGPLLAWHAFRSRRRYDVVLSDGEQVGLPFALLCRFFGRRGSRHVMIVHILTTPTKSRLLRWARLGRLVDVYLVYSTRQQELLCTRLGIDPERVVLIPFMVDTRFFDRSTIDVEPRRMICSAGLERRDYPTLMEAVEGLDVEVVIAAASPWSRQADSTRSGSLPANVRVERLSLFDLRALYAGARFVVMPLVEVDFQAGITTILEAMSMGKAVVCSRTEGQTDALVDGVTGVYVPPGDPQALRRAIEGLLDDGAASDRIGAAARAWVVEHADIERYADLVGGVVASLPTA